jgi:hypothetical protein
VPATVTSLLPGASRTALLSSWLSPSKLAGSKVSRKRAGTVRAVLLPTTTVVRVAARVSLDDSVVTLIAAGSRCSAGRTLSSTSSQMPPVFPSWLVIELQAPPRLAS